MKSCLVIGASGTIGSAVAKRLASPGLRLGLHYFQNHGAVESLRAACEARGANCSIMQSPLDSEADCGAFVGDFCSRYGELDGLALCSGTVAWMDWASLTGENWQEMFWQHCQVPFHLAKAAVVQMRKVGKGSIVYLSSISAKYGGSPSSLHYAASKAAVETTMRGLSRIHAGTGIRINGVRSGFVNTPQQRSGRTPEQIRARIEQIPMGRAGTPEDIASAFAYLLSDESGFVTGETITVAGGD